MNDFFQNQIVNPSDNTLLFYESLGDVDLNVLVSKVMSMGDFAMSNFFNSEFMLRKIMEQEAVSSIPPLQTKKFQVGLLLCSKIAALIMFHL